VIEQTNSASILGRLIRSSSRLVTHVKDPALGNSAKVKAQGFIERIHGRDQSDRADAYKIIQQRRLPPKDGYPVVDLAGARLYLRHVPKNVLLPMDSFLSHAWRRTVGDNTIVCGDRNLHKSSVVLVRLTTEGSPKSANDRSSTNGNIAASKPDANGTVESSC
jgi:hypothetical protein